MTNNVDTVANLTLTKTNNPSDVVIAGRGLLYSMVLTNTGPSVARNVIFRDDQLDSWLVDRYYRYSVNGGAWSDWVSFIGDLMLDVTNSTNFPAGYMGVGENFTVEINSTVNASTPNGTVMNNFANVTSTTSPFEVISPTVTNNVETMAELVITKVADVEKIVRGYPIHYTIVITNNGPSDALDVNFYDDYNPKLLENTYYSTSTGIPWTLYTTPLNITPIINRLAPGENVTIWINGTVSLNASQNLTNTAITESITDPTGPKEAQVTTNIQTAHLTIKKTVNNPRPYLHEIIYFTLVVQNYGPDTAIDVYVIDKLPSGVVYIRSVANYGYYNVNTGYWIIGDLPRNTIAYLTITVGVEKLGPIENHAHVYAATWDPILRDHSSTATIYVQAKKGKTVPMQRTGVPVAMLLMAVLMVFVPLFAQKRKN